jgi:hypothetical protein
VALCLLTFPLGLQQAQNLYESWPSSTQLTTFLRPRVQAGSGHYLAEDFEVLRYYLKNETDTWQWSSLDYFVYTDKEKQNLSGEAAYKAAIQEGYFNLIELSYGYHASLAIQISQSLIASQYYDLIARIPFHDSYGDGYFWVWSKHAGVPNSTANVVCRVCQVPMISIDMPSRMLKRSGARGGFYSSQRRGKLAMHPRSCTAILYMKACLFVYFF